MIGFKLDVIGETQVERTLLRFGENATHAAELWPHLARRLREIEQLQFSTEGAHGSGGWAPLAESTVKAKRRRGQPESILRATDRLMNSLIHEGAEDSIFENMDTWMRYGTAVPYATYHQTGTRRMPRRRVVQLTEDERRKLTKMVQRFIVTGEVAE